MTKVKGSKITSKFSYLESQHKEGSKEQVLASLGGADQGALSLILETNWYPQDLYVRLLKAICKTVGAGDERIYAHIGEYSADHQFTHVYRAYRASDLTTTLQNMVPVHARLNDPSGMQVTLEGSERATIVVTAPASDPVACAVSRGFYRRVVELHGAHDVEVREPACSGRGDRACRFEIHWTPPTP